MKAFNTAIKAMAALLLAGALLVSCGLNTADDNGTLLIKLPGSTARATGDPISASFMNTLSYLIDCAGPGKASRKIPYGEAATISLSPGEWKVTVSALNAADQHIGSYTETAIIENGKTTVIPMNIKIDTSRNSITNFWMSWYGGRSVSFRVEDPFDQGGHVGQKMIVLVPDGSSIVNDYSTQVTAYFTHTGVKTTTPTPSPDGYALLPSGSTLRFDQLGADGLTVTAENGSERTYYFEIEELPPVDGRWPDLAIWSRFGFSSGISRPSGVTITSAAIADGALAVTLDNFRTQAFNSLMQSVEAIYPGGYNGSIPGYNMYTYYNNYTIQPGDATEYTISIMVYPGFYGTLSITPDPSPVPEWPRTETWKYHVNDSFDLQPSIQFTPEINIVEYLSPMTGLMVSLQGNEADTKGLCTELVSLLNINGSIAQSYYEEQVSPSYYVYALYRTTTIPARWIMLNYVNNGIYSHIALWAGNTSEYPEYSEPDP